MTKDMLSITEAAKRVGYSRQRLSAMIDEAGLERQKQGKNVLVDLVEVQLMLQRLGAEKKLQTPKSARKEGGGDNELVTHLKEEVRRLTQERNEAQERFRAAESASTQLKLLEASKEVTDRELEKMKKEKAEKDREIDDLVTKVESLEAGASEAKALREQLKLDSPVFAQPDPLDL